MYSETAISAIFPQNNGKPAFNVTLPKDQRVLTVPLSIYFFHLDFKDNHRIIFEIKNLDTNQNIKPVTFEIKGEPEYKMGPVNSQLSYNLVFNIPDNIPDKSSFALKAILQGDQVQTTSHPMTYFDLRRTFGGWN
ncbi:hypothetical protein [Weissella confusa]|uniref:hypothetical protein n=1 Tax=Weissella confusa TaxID=1583 RepID=UPI001080E5EF|nr:hypothetical protein [Weissella confusa]MBF7056773.1 hypothetical protein [Weissella confusa]TGE61007.1 hypothetical protein C6P19_02365 [Weissella confusa]